MKKKDNEASANNLNTVTSCEGISKKSRHGIFPGSIVLIISICLYGLFYEWTSGIIGMAILVLWIGENRLDRHKEGTICLPKSVFLLSLASLPIFALIGSIWSVDYGMAFAGIIKWYPVTMFILYMTGRSGETRESMIRLVPYVSTVLTAVSGLLYFTPLKELVFINERLMGIFQYANAYAVLLLISILILLFEEGNSLKKLVLVLINASGILLSGSRAVFLLMAFGVAAWMIVEIRTKKRKKLMIGTAAGIFSAAVLSIILSSITGNSNLFSRFTEMSFKTSSVMGRLIYDADGIRLLLQHPFGLGYKGFLFIQGSVESAAYSVTYAHNELLQTGLDYGIIAMALLGVGYVMTVLKEGLPVRNRLILILVGIHSLFDWDFQFGALLFIIILFMDGEWKNCFTVKGKGWAFKIALTVMTVISVWLSSAFFLEYAGNPAGAIKIYPYLTTSGMKLLNETTGDERHALAEDIIGRNDYVTIALQAMAEKSASEGDFANMEKYADQALRSARYNSEGYEIYIYMMYFAYDVCRERGMREASEYFLEKIAAVEDTISEVMASTSPNAEYIYDSSEIKLGEDYRKLIEYAKNG